jgi:arylsulfatase A-like enzyme
MNNSSYYNLINKIMNQKFLSFITLSAISFGMFSCQNTEKQKDSKKPAVIFILTDDQGYGDLACHGNQVIQTPHMDKLYSESVRFTNYHCGTTCAPTRAGIITGKYNNKVGVWHTVMGRYLLRQGEKTIADVFKDAGYKTAIFGKWHLGDNYPYHPNDRGFDVAVTHGGGGVGQTPDYWNNDYFDDTYFKNRKPEKYEGYCTDIWFNEAINFIEEHKDRPFFCYLSTNAPHGPYYVPQKYREMYLNKENVPKSDSHGPNFYGMITNIDDNIGKLRNKLRELGIEKDMILIFSTDNGTSAGIEQDNKGFKNGNGYNAGMRGHKGSKYEGGHRVPLFIKWDAKDINGGKDINELVSFVDIMPTLLDLCQIPFPPGMNIDGVSLKSLLTGQSWNHTDRIIFTDTQRELFLKKWKDCAVMKRQWRLIDGTELYDIQKDPGQKNDISNLHPVIVDSLRSAYENWWKEVSLQGDEYSAFIAGTEAENPMILTCHDWYAEEIPPWSQNAVRKAQEKNGYWMVAFSEPGKYQVKLRRWPFETDYHLNDSASTFETMKGVRAVPAGEPIKITKACLKIGENTWDTIVNPIAREIVFNVTLKKGERKVQTWLTDEQGTQRGAYYCSIQKLK